MVRKASVVFMVLIGVAPAGFVVNLDISGYDITRTRDAVNNVDVLPATSGTSAEGNGRRATATDPCGNSGHAVTVPLPSSRPLSRWIVLKIIMTGIESYDNFGVEQRSQLRRIMLCLSDITDRVSEAADVNT